MMLPTAQPPHRSPRLGRPLDAPLPDFSILLVGGSTETSDALRDALRAAFPIGIEPALHCRDRFPESDLRVFGAILVHAERALEDAPLLAADPDLAWRSRVVVELRDVRSGAVVAGLAEPPLSLLLLAREADEQEFERDIRQLLLAEALVHHLSPAVAGCCASDGQGGLIRAFLRRAQLGRARDVATDLRRASRSLVRDCAGRGLQSPRALHRAARVFATVHCSARAGLPFPHAAAALGYAEVKSFRRATRAAFGVAPSALLAEWEDPSRMADRVARGCLRRIG